MSMTLGEIIARISRLLTSAGLGQGVALNEIIIHANDAYRTVAQLSGGLVTSVTQAPTVGAGSATISDPTGQSLNKILFVSQAGGLLVEVPEILLLGGLTSFPYPVYAWNFASTTKKVYWAGITSTISLNVVVQWIPKGNVLLADSTATSLSTELDEAMVLYLEFRLLTQELFRSSADKMQRIQATITGIMQDMQKFDFFRGWTTMANLTSNPNGIPTP